MNHWFLYAAHYDSGRRDWHLYNREQFERGYWFPAVWRRPVWTGRLIGAFAVKPTTDRCLFDYEAYLRGLGVLS